MADKKISQLTALSAANVASATDVLAIVDTSATETKKITAKDLIDGALNGGTANGVLYLNGSKVATSGSALTFDGTNFGIGTASPGYKLSVSGVATTYAASGSLALYDTVSGVAESRNWLIGNVAAGNYGELNFAVSSAAGGAPTNSKMTLDRSGNLGLGVTPSLWNSDYKALNIGSKGIVYGRVGSQETAIGANWYRTTAAAFVYASNGFATFYAQDSGNHTWHIAPNNTSGAGATASFTQAMTLDASGNLGLGATSITALGSGYTTQAVKGDNGAGFRLYQSTNERGRFYADSTGAFVQSVTSIPLAFYTDSTERGRFTAGGVLCINSTSNVGSEITLFKQTAGAGSPVTRTWNDSTSGNNEFIEFATESSYTSRGSITYNRTAGLVSYNTTSDVRLKENIADAEEAGSKIDAMQVRQFDWKETGNHLDYGFVAQELHDVAPYAVSKPEDDDKMWSVDYSKLVPMLVKEIQSLRSRVAALEAK